MPICSNPSPAIATSRSATCTAMGGGTGFKTTPSSCSDSSKFFAPGSLFSKSKLLLPVSPVSPLSGTLFVLSFSKSKLLLLLLLFLFFILPLGYVGPNSDLCPQSSQTSTRSILTFLDPQISPDGSCP